MTSKYNLFPDTICVPQQTTQCKIYSRCTINTEIAQVEEYQGGITEKDGIENQDFTKQKVQTGNRNRCNKKLKKNKKLLSHEKERTEEKQGEVGKVWGSHCYQN